MRRQRILTSTVEELEPWERTRERLAEIPKPELEKFVHDFTGRPWCFIRGISKTGLIDWIMEEWETNWRDS